MTSGRLGVGALPVGVSLAVVLFVGLTVGWLSWAAGHATYDTWAGALVALALSGLGLFLVRFAARREELPSVARLLPLAFALKMGAAIVRLVVSFGLYDGLADADTYHDAGEELYRSYRHLDFSGDVGRLVGTGFMKALTGLVYAVIGPTRLGGFFLFSFLGFWGLYFFYRAFCLGCPEGDRRRYALLVLFLPSLLFWPSSIGKEAWMTFTLGLATLGAARLLTHHRGGLTLLSVGVAGTAVVRPHVSVIIVVALLAAVVLRRAPAGASLLRPLAKLGAIVLLGVGLVFLINQTESLFGLDRFNREAIGQVLERARSQTSEGGSTFQTEVTDFSPARFPSALVSVLFRPYPWEAHNTQAFIASLEGSLLLVLFVVSWRRMVGAVRSLIHNPYVLFCFVYGVLFVYGFSSFANFGVLTRQRVQAFPFILVLLALPPFTRVRKNWRALLQPASEPADPAQAPPSRERCAGTTRAPK